MTTELLTWPTLDTLRARNWRAADEMRVESGGITDLRWRRDFGISGARILRLHHSGDPNKGWTVEFSREGCAGAVSFGERYDPLAILERFRWVLDANHLQEWLREAVQ